MLYKHFVTMNLYPLVPLSAWIVTIFVWAYVFGRRRGDPVTCSFLLFTSAYALSLTLVLLLEVPAFHGSEAIIFRLIFPLWMSLGALFLNFAYRLVGRPPDAVFWFFVAATACSMAFSFGTDMVLLGYVRRDWGAVDIRDPVYNSLACLAPVSASCFGLWLVLRERQRTRGRLPRRHLGLVLYGGLASLGLVVLLNIALPDLFGIEDCPRLGTPAKVLFVLAVFRAVVRHRFLAIDVEQVAGELFDEASDGIALLDNRGLVLRMNPAARDLLGRISSSDTGSDLAELLPGYAAEAFAEREFTVPAGATPRIIAAAQTASTPGSTSRGLILTLRDVTEGRRAEQELRRSREDLEREIRLRTAELRRSQQMEALGLLAGGVAHDLHNLLAAILGFAAAARDDLSPEDAIREDLDEVIAAAGRARDIVHQILAFSRKEQPERKVVPLADAVEESLVLLEASLPPTIELRRDYRAAGALAEADTAQLHQVIVNLANNACDALGESGGVLTVTIAEAALDEAAARDTHQGLGPGRYLRLGVRDTGPGMPPSVRERMFEPFFTTRKAERRTGLGLSIVSRIVREHGGAVLVESAPGRGTEIAVLLPRAAARAGVEVGG